MLPRLKAHRQSVEQLRSNWSLRNSIEDAIRETLSPSERKYLASHVSPKNRIRRCSKNHVISTLLHFHPVGNEHRLPEYATHGKPAHESLKKDCAEVYIRHYDSEPDFIELSETERKRRELELLSSPQERVKVVPVGNKLAYNCYSPNYRHDV